MLLMGDEFQRSQGGNNNPYCQDNEISWLNWGGGRDPSLLVFLQNLSRLRRSHLDFHRKKFFTGKAANDSELKDIYWLAPDGREMTIEDWFEPQRQTLGLQVGNHGDAKERILLLISAAAEPVEFQLDPAFPCLGFRAIFSSTEPEGFYSAPPLLSLKPGGSFCLASRSIVLLEHV
jgi:glycogen operon protein